MGLSSYLFLFIFFPVSFFLYFVVPNKYKKCYLLIVSMIFLLTFSLTGALLLFLLTIINYILGNKVVNNRKLLIIGIIFNVIMLIFFKYINFFITNINYFLHTEYSLFNILAPVGLSFLVFQNISYLVDSYKGIVNGNLIDYCLYNFYFPRVINGPIMRFNIFKDEINKLSNPNVDNIFEGIKRISFGLGKIFIVSTVTGNIWQTIYAASRYSSISALTAWFGIICYSLYLYLNFSGFIDLSLGISKVFNIVLPENFNYPYQADSISVFWRKWHITLSNWFRDYVYIPLGGNRKGNVYINLMVVFILTGIWHGSSWNFIIWGIYNGVIIVIEKWLRKKEFYNKIPKVLKIGITYFLVLFGWVLFACNGISASIDYYRIMFGIGHFNLLQYDFSYFVNCYNLLFIGIAISISFGLIKHLTSKIKNKKAYEVISGIVVVALLCLSIIYIINNNYVPSIYANF